MSSDIPDGAPVPRRVRIRPGWLPPNPRSSSSEADPQHVKLHTAPVQHAATAVAGVFWLVGLAGFIPGLTSDIGALEFAGHHSGALLFGLFTVSVLHNVVHLLFGVAGLALATSAQGSRMFLFGGGVVYLLLALYGALVPHGSGANFIPVNTADNWLHVGLGLGMLALGLLPGRTER
jgi:hypothetical protein